MTGCGSRHLGIISAKGFVVCLILAESDKYEACYPRFTRMPDIDYRQSAGQAGDDPGAPLCVSPNCHPQPMPLVATYRIKTRINSPLSLCIAACEREARTDHIFSVSGSGTSDPETRA